VIVGSGFTGLATALFLAREHGIRATVLEANRVAWGCTSRNGGQGQNASGRLYRSQWIERWGLDVAKKLDAEIRYGFQTFADLSFRFVLTPAIVVKTLLFSLVMGLVGGFLPAMRAARLNIVDALRAR